MKIIDNRTTKVADIGDVIKVSGGRVGFGDSLYIIAPETTSGRYVAVDLKRGAVWSNPQKTIEDLMDSFSDDYGHVEIIDKSHLTITID